MFKKKTWRQVVISALRKIIFQIRKNEVNSAFWSDHSFWRFIWTFVLNKGNPKQHFRDRRETLERRYFRIQDRYFKL